MEIHGDRRFADDRRIALRPHDKDGRKPGQLWPVYKNLGLHRFSRGILTNVGNNADNLSHGALAVVCNDNLLPDWILTWKVLPCQHVVNHRDRWSIRRIAFIKFTANQQPRLEDTEIICADGTVAHGNVTVRQWIPFNIER